MKINNIIIFDGKKEFEKDVIESDLKLKHLANTLTAFGGYPTLVERINKENGLLYITTDPNHESGKTELRNVSKELYSEYLVITK